MQSPFRRFQLRKKLALALAAMLLLFCVPLAAPASAEPAMVRVLLSTEGASSLTVTVTGTYRLVESDDTFTGGKLTLTASGSSVIVTHSSAGRLYSGACATIERTDLARTAGHLTLPVAGYSRSYLGHLVVTADGGELQVVNRVPLSHYLYGVVAYEMSNSFPLEALKAQAVAAKNYALPRLGSSGAYDIGDTASDQVYKGYNSANTNVIEAVDATMNVVLLLNGAVMPCYYSASNGGYMNKPSDNWSGGTAYDAGYSSGYDDYDMKNSLSPRETLFIPSEFTEKSVRNDALYTLVMEALSAAIASPGSIPDGYLFEGLSRITSVVSTDDAGGMEGLDHTNAVFTALVTVVRDEDARSSSATPAPATPTPATPTPATPTPAEGTTEGGPVPLSAEAMRSQSQAGAAVTTVVAAAPVPVDGEPEGETPTGTPASGEAEDEQAESTPAPSEEPTPSPAPTQTPAPAPSLSATLSEIAEVPVTFTIPFAAMAEAGLFTATNLRIYYATPSDGGFTITHARYGHGVGMSQRGAQQMANEGKTYREILAYYYGGATLSSYSYTLPEEQTTVGGTGGASEPVIASARVKGSAVNLRKSASSSSASVATLANNTILTVSGLSGEWYAVRVDATGMTGYIHSDYVAMTSDAALARGYVNAAAVNIRTGPSTGYSSLGKLDRNTQVTINALEQGWYRVRVDATGQTGYIIRNYVTVSTAAATPPAATPSVTQTPAGASPTATPQEDGPIPVPTADAQDATPTPEGTGSGGTTPTPAGTVSGAATPTPAVETPAFLAYGQINATRVNFRKGPSTSTTSMAKLDRPEQLGIYEKVGNWYRVRVLSLDKDGYVYAKYVTLTGSASGASGEEMGAGQINATGVNIRTGPSTAYTSLGKLGKRTALTILGSEGSWYRVRVDESGLEGFVFGKYVTITADGAEENDSQATTGQGVVNTGLLVLRDNPGSEADSRALLSMRIGYTVTVHSISGEWAYVTFNGKQGYCVAKCILMN